MKTYNPDYYTVTFLTVSESNTVTWHSVIYHASSPREAENLARKDAARRGLEISDIYATPTSL